MGNNTRYLLEALLPIVVVSVLAVVVLFAARRLGMGKGRGPLRLVGQLPLDARRGVYLVQVADKVLVVGVSEAGMTKLAELESTELPTAQEPQVAPRFADVLNKLMAGKSAAGDDEVGR